MSWADESSRWVREAGAVFVKDARTEWRTRVAASATGLFAVGAVLLIALVLRQAQAEVSFQPRGVEPEEAARVARDVAKMLYAMLLWVLLFFTASTGLGRAFVLEEERGTGLTLRLVARGSAVWSGKFALNLGLLLGLAALVAPLLWAAVGIQGPTNLLLLGTVLVLGCVGLASVLTFTSALVAQASAKGGLLAVLSLPVLVPLFAASVHGTLAALGLGARSATPEFALGASDLQVLTSFAVISVTSSLMLFEYLWND